MASPLRRYGRSTDPLRAQRATAAQQITEQSLWDGVAALAIMTMLILVALALARDNRGLLIGEAIEPEEERKIVDLLRRETAVDDMLDIVTMRLGPESTFVAARISFSDDVKAADIRRWRRMQRSVWAADVP